MSSVKAAQQSHSAPIAQGSGGWSSPTHTTVLLVPRRLGIYVLLGSSQSVNELLHVGMLELELALYVRAISLSCNVLTTTLRNDGAATL